jgi:hypothetical protein
MAELLAQSKSVEEWVDVFGVLDSAETELTLDEVEHRLEFLSLARAHKTPKKPEQSSPSPFGGSDLNDMLESVPDEIVKGSDYEWSRDFPDDFVAAMESVGRTVTTLASTVPTALSDSALRAERESKATNRVCEQMNARLISLECAIGSRREVEEDLPPTLWEAVASLWSQGPGDSAQMFPDDLRLTSTLESVRDKFDSASQASKAVGKELSDYKDRVNKLLGAVSQGLAKVVKVQNDTTREVGRVASAVASIERGSGHGGDGGAVGGLDGLDSILASLGSGPSGGSEDVAALRKEVAALRSEIRHLNDRENDEAVEIGGLSFSTQDDLAAWLLEEAPGLPFGTIVDYHALMQQVQYDQGGYDSVDVLLKSLKLRNDMALSTTGDVLALAALRSGLPAVLGEGKAATGEDRSSFNAFHTFADWKNPNGRDGFVNTLPKRTHKAVRAVEVDIANRLEPGSPASMLASACLTKASAFSDAFVIYLTTTYEDLTLSSGFPKKRAWALTTALGARICEEIHKDSSSLARSLSVSTDETDRDKLTVLLIWATLRAHKMMDEYIQMEFKDHPTVASEYVKFLATNSGYETVAGLQSKLDSVEKELASVKKTAVNASNAADTAKSVATEAKKLAAKKGPP